MSNSPSPTPRHPFGAPSWPDDLIRWRQRRLLAIGFSPQLGVSIAADPDFDLHALIELTESGCPPHLAARILAPLSHEEDPC